MRRIVLVAYPLFELLDASDPIAVFNNAKRLMAERGEPDFYRVELVSAGGGPVTSSSGVVVETGSLRDTLTETIDTILVVGAERAAIIEAMGDAALKEGLSAAAGAARRFGSVCTGAFLLAASGLLDGRKVATHWEGCAPLAAAFPSITVDPHSLYVEDRQLWTSAGVTTGIDMTLAMVAQDAGGEIASEIAKLLVLYACRPGYQSQFSPLLQAQAKAGSPFADLVAWIHSNLTGPLDVPALSERAGLSERTFHRRFLAATGQTPAHFVETARLDAARMLLSRGLSLKYVAARVGLSPAERFADAFERRFGVSPRLFREMHAMIA